MKVVAIIPARAGSKGIPNKNLIEVQGKPLISWTIEAGLEAEIDTVVVSSDGADILACAQQYKEVVAIERPAHLAEDNTPTAPVITHALKALGISEKEYDYLVLLQPTSPLREAADINKALTLIQEKKASALISVVEPEHHPLKSFVRNEHGFLEGAVNDDFPFMPRQELPKAYQPNGAIYIIEIKEFLEKETFFTDKTIEYLMSRSKSIDVDSLEDIEKIENQLKTNPPC